MPGNVDEKVLSMQFDNKQFEKGIEESSKSLDEFKKKLDFSKITSGLKTFSSGVASIGKGGFNTLKTGAEKTTSALNKLKSALSLSKATKSLTELGAVSFEGLQSGMQSLGEKLESLGNLGEMAMYRVKNAILDAAQSAISFGKSLSVDQIQAGLGKYEEKISSIKTISNATKLSAEQVNDQLDHLNWFTDETSANFSDMVNNIGKFTSVGKGLSESITAMQGIATWGYHSGASIAEQSRAMYNLSQALGTGSVKLMDWKSIENAGMATKEFKEQAIAAAEAAGTLTRKNGKLYTKKGNKKVTAENFNSTLAQGWFTSDVLMSTLEEYGGFASKVREYQEAHPGKFSLASEAMEQMDIDRLKERLNALTPDLDSLAKKTGKDSKQLKTELQEIMDYASDPDDEDFSYEKLEQKVNSFTRTLGISMEKVSEINKIADTKERTKEIKKWAETLGVDVKTAEKLLSSLAETEETLGEKAFKSSQQAKSFTEAIDATKDAVSTQWMNSFQIIFGGLDDSIKLWSDVTEMLWDIFASGGDARNNMLEHWAEDFNGREDLFGEDGFLHSIYDSIMSVKGVLGTSFKDVFFPSLNAALSLTQDQAKDVTNGLITYDQLKYIQEGNLAGAELKEITKSIKEFGQTIKNFFTDKDNVANMGRVLKGVFSVFQAGKKILDAVTGGFGDFLKQSGAAKKVLSIFGDIGDKVSSFLRELQVSGTWHELQAQITETLMGFDGLLDNIDLDFITTGLQAIFDVFKGGWKFLRAVLNGVSSFLKNSGIINKVLKIFNQLAARVSSFVESITDDSTIQSVTDTVVEVLTTIGSLIDDINLNFVTFALHAIWESVRGIAGFVKAIVNGVAKGLKKSGALKTLSNIVTKISDAVTKFFNTIRNNGDLKKFEDGITDLVAQFSGLFDNLDLSGLETILTGAWGIITNAWEGIKSVFTGIIEFLDAFGIPQAVIDVFTKLGSWFTWLSDKMSEFHVWEDFTEHLKSAAAKLKEVFDHFKEEIGRFLEDSGIASKFREWKEKLKEWLFPSSLGENGEVTGIAAIFKKIREAFNNGIEQLKNIKIYDWLMEKWQWLKDSGIIQGLKDFWATIKGIFSGGSGEGAESAKEGEETIEAQSGFFDKLKEFISKIDFGSLSGALLGIGALFVTFKAVSGITKLIKSVTKVITGVGEVVSGLGDITGNFAASLKKSTKWAQIGVMVAAIGAAIWLIADSVSKLGQLSTDQLIQGGIAMVICAGVLVGLIAALKALSKDKAAISIKDLLAITVVTILMGKLADTVVKLGDLGLDKALTGLAAFGIMLLMLYGFMDLIKAETKSQTMVDIGFLFTIGDAMLKLSDVVIKLGALPAKQLIKGLVGMASMMLMLGLFMRMTNVVINDNYYVAKNTAGFMKLIGLALSVWLLSKVLMNLSAMSWDQIGKGLAAMAGIMILLGTFMRATTVQFDLGNGVFSKNTAGFFKMIGLAIVMLVMARVLKKLGDLEWDQIGRGLAALAGVMLILGVFMKATTTTFNINYYNNKNQAGFLKLIGVALAMLVLAKVLKSLAQLSWEQIGRGLTAMAGIMVLIGVFIKTMTTSYSSLTQRFLTQNNTGFFKLMGIALAIVLLAHSFKGLANLSWTAIIKGIIAMTAIMGLMAIIVKVASGTGIGAGVKLAVTFGVMIGIGVAVTLFALSLRSLASLPLEGIIKGLIGVTGILLAIAAFMKLTSNISTAGGMMKGLLVLIPIAAAMGLFVLALSAVKDMNPTVIAAFGVGLGAVIAAMSYLVGTIVLFGRIPIGAALKGSLVVAAMMTIILGVATALVAGLGALANIVPGFKAALETGVEVFTLIGKAFGGLIGGFIGGILSGIASAGPAFADGIDALGKGLKSFSESIQGTSGVSDKDREAAIDTLIALVAIAHLLPRSGGLLQFVIGQTDMKGFASDIAALGNGLKSFANSIKGMSKLDKNDEKTAIRSIMALVGIAHALPRKGGLIQAIFGQGDLGEFASNIGDLGKGLRTFSNSVKGMGKSVDSGDMDAAMDMANNLAVFAKFVTDPGSFGDVLRLGLGKMLGVNTDFSTFVGYIEPFGKALNAYAKAVKGVGALSGDSSNAIAIAEDILKFKNAVEDPGTVGQILLNWFANITGTKTTFQDFIDQIEPFGNAMKAYAGAIGGFTKKVSEEDSAAVIAAAASIKSFRDKFGSDNFGEAVVNAIDSMFGNSEVKQFDTFIAQIVPFGEAIKKYAETVKGFSTNISTEDTDSAIAAAEGIKKFAEKFKSGGLGEAILKGIDSLFGSGETVGFANFTAQMVPFGEGLKAYAEGIANIAQISDTDRESALAAANGLKDFAKSFGNYNTGTAGQGLFAYIVDRLSGAFAGQTTAMSEFATFSSGMVDFGTGLTNYADGIKNIATLQPGQADTAMQTVEAIKKFAESLVPDSSQKTWLDNLMSFGALLGGGEESTTGSALSQFGTSMQELGKGIAEFAKAAGTVNIENSDNAIKAVEAIAELANSDILKETGENQGGILNDIGNFFSGNKVEMLKNFAKDMGSFGEAISTFATSIQDYPTEDLPVDRCVKAVQDFVAAIKVLTGDDTVVDLMGFNGKFIDVLQSITNSDESQRRYQALTDAIKGMGEFGTNISSFSNALKDYESPSSKAWDGLKQMLGDMEKFADDLYKMGYGSGAGVWTIYNLAQDLHEAIPEFVEITKLINGTSKEAQDAGKMEAINGDVMKSFESLVTILGSLTGMLSKMPETNKFYNLEQFGKGVIEIGNGLSSVFTAISSLTESDIAEGGKIDQIIKMIDAFKIVAVAFAGFENMPSYRLKDFGWDLKEFFNSNISQIQWDKVNVTKMNDVASAVTMLAYAAARIKEAAVTAADIGVMGEIVSLLLGLNGTGDDDGTGETLAKNFVLNFCKTLSAEVTVATSSNGDAFIAGHNMSIGFANGMQNEAAMTAIAVAARAVALKAIEAMKAAADEASPSKETEQIGKYMNDGLAIGLGENQGDIAKNATSAVGLALEAFSAALDEDPEEQPTITPVVDLSKVESGADAAGAMLGGKYTMGVNTSADLAGRAANKNNNDNEANNINVNVDTSNIASTIETMNAQLNALASQMTNLKVVMNSGALVGQIAPQMNRELGRIANGNVAS